MELEERLNRRFNYRHFKEDDMPSKETIERILQDAINFVPIKNEGYNFKLEIWGPEHYDEKRELAIHTIAKREHMFGVNIKDEDKWYENATKLYEYEEENNWKPKAKGRATSYFNNQVRAPYLVSVVLAPNTWNPKDEPVWDVLDSFMAGMFTYGVSVVANEYGVDCAFCSCFEKGLKDCINYITTAHDHSRVYPELVWRQDQAKNSGRMQGKSNCLTLIGLGYYDFFGKEKIYTGSVYDTEKRIKISGKDTKPKLENIAEWK
tara:strand:- start:131 stop:919 length:789 start_codon:yes stop_codon:yes gene_type:complete